MVLLYFIAVFSRRVLYSKTKLQIFIWAKILVQVTETSVV